MCLHQIVLFRIAIQIQASWAYELNVNLLAAGASNPSVGSTGSGIYTGRGGTIKSFLSGTPQSRLFVATVPKVPGGILLDEPTRNYDSETMLERMDPTLPIGDEVFPIALKQDSVKSYTMKWINTTKLGQTAMSVCNDGLCCDFQFFVQKIIYLPIDPIDYLVSRAMGYDTI